MKEASAALFILRGIDPARQWSARPVPSKQPFRMEAIFTSRAEAEAAHADWEREAASKGDPGPLLDAESLDELIAMSDFEPGVFRDYLMDHDIPNPETFESKRAVADLDGLGDWLWELSPAQVTALYAALHRFRFYELVEVPFVVGEYGPERWEAWEKAVPARTPPDEEDDGWRDVEGGFEAVPSGSPPEGWYEQQYGQADGFDGPAAGMFPPAPAGAGWDEDGPNEGGPPPPTGEDDSIPF